MKTSFLFYLVIFVSECSVCMQALEPRVKCTKSKNGLLAVSITVSLDYSCYMNGWSWFTGHCIFAIGRCGTVSKLYMYMCGLQVSRISDIGPRMYQLKFSKLRT